MDPLAGKTVSACVAELIAKPPRKAADFCDGSGPWYPRLRSVLQIAGVSRRRRSTQDRPWRDSWRAWRYFRPSISSHGLARAGGPIFPFLLAAEPMHWRPRGANLSRRRRTNMATSAPCRPRYVCNSSSTRVDRPSLAERSSRDHRRSVLCRPRQDQNRTGALRVHCLDQVCGHAAQAGQPPAAMK